MKQALLVAGKGFCMGAADVVPGVSGGTMALILGIYPRLIAAIRAIDLEFFRLIAQGRMRAAAHHIDALFLLFLGLGIAGALGFFTRIMALPELLVTHPQFVYSVFFGLICMSLYLLLRPVTELGPGNVAWILTGALMGGALTLAVPVDTPQNGWFLVLCGAAAACAMILPGISGAFVLLMLNQYALILGAVGRLDVPVLAPFAFGALCGLAFGSRALSWCLDRFRRRTVHLMAGIVLGALHAVWPFRGRRHESTEEDPLTLHSNPVWPESFDANALSSLALATLAALAVLALQRMARRTSGGG